MGLDPIFRLRGSEDRLTTVSTIDDVEKDVWSIKPRLSGHRTLAYHGTGKGT